MKTLLTSLMVLLFASICLYSQSVGINEDGSAPNEKAILELKSETKGFLPPRMDIIKIFQIANPPEGLIVYNTTYKFPMFFNGTNWCKYDGTIVTLSVGSICGGGRIAYILQPGDAGYDPNKTHGIIAADTSYWANNKWGCDGTLIPGAIDSVIGTGMQNTIDIVNGCATVGTAAWSCYNFSFDGYEDWFLPSNLEMLQIIQNKNIIYPINQNDYLDEFYWTSKQYDSGRAYVVSRYRDNVTFDKSSSIMAVKPCRYF